MQLVHSALKCGNLKSKFLNRGLVLKISLLSIFVLYFLVVWLTYRITAESSIKDLKVQANHNLALYVEHIRKELFAYEYLPRLLAKDYRVNILLDHPENRTYRAELNHYLKFVTKTSGAADIYLMGVSGLTLASSNWDSAESFVGHNYGFRPYFKEAVKGEGDGRYYAVGVTTSKPGYFFASPVKTSSGRVIGVIVVKAPVASLEYGQGALGCEFLVSDSDGIVFLSTKKDWLYHIIKPINDKTLSNVESSRRYPMLVTKNIGFENNDDLISNDFSLFEKFGGGGSNNYRRYGVFMPDFNWWVYALINDSSVKFKIFYAVILSSFAFWAAFLLVAMQYQRRARFNERLRYEHAAMETAESNEAKTRAIIDNTQAGLVALDCDGSIIFINPTAESLFGYSNVTGRRVLLTELLVPESRPSFSRRLELVKKLGSSQPPLQLQGLHRYGRTVPVEVFVSRMPQRGEIKFIVTLHDVSERISHEAALQRAHDQMEQRVVERTQSLVETNRRLSQEIRQHKLTEKELTQARSELVQAAKLAAIGQLSAGINHELNQPLTAIRFYASNAQTYLRQARVAAVYENLKHIDSLTDRMAKIVTQLKLFARRSSGKAVPVSMVAVVEGALTLLAPRLQNDSVSVIRDLPETEVYCLGDIVRLEQVVVNLISNALQAMDGIEKPRLEVHVSQTNGFVETVVRDWGRGIANDDLPQIFDPFFTTKEAGDGLGLGLSISMRIIEELGGTLRARNHPYGGAVFTLTLSQAPSQESEHV